MTEYVLKISATTYSAAVQFEHFYKFRYRKELNKLSEFRATVYDLTTAQKALVKEGNLFYLLYGSDLVLKGEIRNVDANDADQEWTVEGNGMEIKLHDRAVRGRMQWDDAAADEIVQELISGTDLAEGTIESAIKVGFRAEEDSVLRSIMVLANAIGYDWYVDQDVSLNTDRLNFVSHRGSLTSTETFSTEDAAIDVSRHKDVDNVFNVVRVFGYGDGVNQLMSESFAATANRATLAAEISATATYLTVTEAIDSFLSSGDLRCGREWIKYGAKDNGTKTFSSLTRGYIPAYNPPSDNPYCIAAYAHKKGAEIIDLQYSEDGFPDYATAQSGSSIKTYGIRETVFPERALMHQTTADLLAQRLVNKYKEPVERVEFVAAQEHLTAEIGDIVMMAGVKSPLLPSATLYPSTTLYPTAGLIPYRLIAYEFDEDDYAMRLTLGGPSEDFLEDLSQLQKGLDLNSIYGLGATIAFCLPSFAQNIEKAAGETFYAYQQFRIPDNTKAINYLKLFWYLDNFRIHSKVTASESAHTHQITGQSSQSAGSHSHGFGSGQTTQAQQDSYYVYGKVITDDYYGNLALDAHRHDIPNHKHSIAIENNTVDYPVGIHAGVTKFVADGASGNMLTEDKTGLVTSYPDEGDYITGYVPLNLSAQYNFTRKEHYHSLQGATTETQTSHAHTITGIATDAGSAHSHGIEYGIKEEGSPASSIAVQIKVGAGDWTALPGSPYSGDQAEVDILPLIGVEPGGKIVQLRFLPNTTGRCWLRGGGDFQGFVESK